MDLEKDDGSPSRAARPSFRVLGPLEALVGDRLLKVGGPQLRTLLALLLARPNQVVSLAALVDGLWGHTPPPDADKTAQTYMSRLRRALAPAHAGQPAEALVVTSPPGYLIRVDPSSVDAVRFERLAVAGRRALDGGDPAVAADRLREALGLWRGEAYGEFRGSEALRAENARLDELRLSALEDRIEADLATGWRPELIAELDGLVISHPHRERLWAHLMVALYRSGRQAESLAAFRRARARLVEDLGVEPSAQLRDLQAQVLAQDPRLARTRPPDPAGELPAPLAAAAKEGFAGRDDELAWLLEGVEQAARGAGRVLVLSGPEGSGKTRLAAEFSRLAAGRGASVAYARGDAAAAAIEAVRPGRAGRGRDGVRVVVLDDLHAADPVSPASPASPVSPVPAALLRLAETGPATGVLVVGLVDADQAGAGLREALGALRRRGAGARALPPLAREQVTEVVRLYIGDPCPPEAVDAVLADSGGQPRRVHQAAARWAAKLAADRVDAAAARLWAPRRGVRDAEREMIAAVVDLQRVGARRREQRLSEPAPPRGVCPYKGLARFEAADAPYFFGRERLVAELVARLVGRELLAVVGPSGSGKSSVVRAGLLPALAAAVLPGSERWRPVVVTPTSRPAEELATSIAPRDGEHVLVVVDQFEEAFTLLSETGRAELVEVLLAAAAPNAGSQVVLTLRADYFGRIAGYPALAALVTANTVLVGAMSAQDIRRAIERPARIVGLRLEPRLTDALLRDAGDVPGGLPLLSTALLALWERRTRRTLTLAAYQEGGGVQRAIGELAESAYARLTEDQRVIARRILLRLVSPGDEQRLAVRPLPIGQVVPAGDTSTRAVLDTLAARRLLTMSEQTVEVAHEALLREWPRLREWLEEDSAGRAIRRHLAPAADQWERSGRHPTELYRGPRLAAALGWLQEHPHEPTQIEQEFLGAGRAQHARERRRRWTIVGGLSVLLAAAGLLGLLAWQKEHRADEESKLALSRSLVNQAELERDADGQLSVLLSVAAFRLNDNAEARGSLLRQAIYRQHVRGILPRHTDVLRDVAFSPDGRTLAAASDDNTVILWDVRGRRLEATLSGHTGPVSAVAFSPNGRTLASAGEDGMVILWDARGRWRDATLFGHTRPVSALAFSPNGRTLASAGEDGMVILWDARGRRREATLPGHTGPVSGVAFGPDGRTLASTSRDGVILWDVGSPSAPIARRSAATGPQASAAFSPDGRLLATASGKQVILWAVPALTHVATLNGHRELVTRVAFSPDGRTLASGSDDKAVILWDVRSRTRMSTLSSHSDSITGLAFSPAEGVLASVGRDRTAILWDVPPPPVSGHAAPVNQVAFSPDGQTLASASDDNTVIRWDLREHARQARLSGHTGPVTAVAFAPDGHLLASAGLDKRIIEWDVNTGAKVDILPASSQVNDVAFSPDGDTLAAASFDKTVLLWDVATGTRIPALTGHTGPLADIAFSPDGTTLATASGNQVILWDVRARARLATLSGHSEYVARVAFSPDGRTLASAGFDGRVVLWDVRARAQLASLAGENDEEVTDVAFSADGRTLASVAWVGDITFWDVAARISVAAIPGYGQDVAYVAFSPDRRTLATAGENDTVGRWDLPEIAALPDRMCGVAGRDLTREEWAQYLPGHAYRTVCA
jgi:WD40 repeat protein/DNA-binding SARP family transcriptional activator